MAEHLPQHRRKHLGYSWSNRPTYGWDAGCTCGWREFSNEDKRFAQRLWREHAKQAARPEAK
jgi:hypothetical protein